MGRSKNQYTVGITDEIRCVAMTADFITLYYRRAYSESDGDDRTDRSDTRGGGDAAERGSKKIKPRQKPSTKGLGA